MWGGFLLLKNVRREIAIIGNNIPVLGLGAFVCCIGGVFLWVGGDASLYYIKTLNSEKLPSLLTMFLLWLTVYALSGAVLAMLCLFPKCMSHKAWIGAVIGGVGYVMMLLWYAVTLCTRLSLLGSFVLVLAIVAYIAVFVFIPPCFVITRVAVILIELLQFYFLIFSISTFLLN